MNFQNWYKICVFVMLGALLGCKSKNNTNPAKAWNELCEITNCEQYPTGYHTAILDGHHYYFPLRPYNNLPRNYGHPFRILGKGEKYEEFITTGNIARMRRRVVFVDKYFFSDHCCKKFLKFFNLSELWPNNFSHAKFRSFISKSNKLDTLGYIQKTPSNWLGELEDEKYQTFKSLKDNGLKSFSKNFWLVDGTHTLVSKRPLLTGRHVLGDCYTTECKWLTFDFKDEKSGLGPLLHIGGITYLFDRTVQCDNSNRIIGCDKDTEGFDKITVAFEVLDKLLTQLSTTPQNAELKLNGVLVE